MSEADMKPPAATIDATMQDITDECEADNVSDSKDEGVHLEQTDGRTSPPAKKQKNKKKRNHKPMNAAEQQASLARLREQLKKFEHVDAAVQPPVATGETVPVEMGEPVAKKRKLSDHRPAGEDARKPLAMDMPSLATARTTVPTTSVTPSPKDAAKSRRTSSNASTSLAHDDLPFPHRVKVLMDKMNAFGAGMERALSGITARAQHLTIGEDADAIKEKLVAMEREWKVSNRERMRQMKEFLERNGIVAIGGVEVPSGSLEVLVQSSEGASSSGV